MAVKVLIKRNVPRDKAKALIPIFRNIRSLAMNQPGYISGETLKRLDRDQFLIISSWLDTESWQNWLKSDERKKLQGQIDELLGGETEYEIFHYGFKQ
jgi:heme-degrading monooxygenase HmoA